MLLHRHLAILPVNTEKENEHKKKPPKAPVTPCIIPISTLRLTTKSTFHTKEIKKERKKNVVINKRKRILLSFVKTFNST